MLQGRCRASGKMVFVVSFFLAVLSNTSYASGGVTRGAMLANSCSACHGTDGQGSGRIPRINGFSKKDMVEMMQDFRTGKEQVTIMNRHAKGYTDEEVSLIADYFAGLKK
jgi:sulfide dehydrogenase cytochrome subunit